VTLRELINEGRRYLSETLLGWAMRVAPMKTAHDLAYGRHLSAALRVALADAQRKARR
jgi:hypothetical protein